MATVPRVVAFGQAHSERLPLTLARIVVPTDLPVSPRAEQSPGDWLAVRAVGAQLVSAVQPSQVTAQARPASET